MNEKRIGVQPLSYGMTGFRVDDLFSKEFIAELKKEMPTSVIAHFCIGFTDSKNLVAVSHDRIEGKFILDRVDVEGDGVDAEQRIKSVVEILKKVLR
ncbi:hypothetical protein MUP01_05425 [Candidatus Bathyarchaeota archaeon]|nr:hypothetical protein [Candidatus Bathyarchaeota archaeon]